MACFRGCLTSSSIIKGSQLCKIGRGVLVRNVELPLSSMIEIMLKMYMEVIVLIDF